MPEFFSRTPLKEDELQQLQALLIRYLYNHASGLANMAIDGAIHAFNGKLGLSGQPQRRPAEYSSEELLLLLG